MLLIFNICMALQTEILMAEYVNYMYVAVLRSPNQNPAVKIKYCSMSEMFCLYTYMTIIRNYYNYIVSIDSFIFSSYSTF
jgi:hypothetical protein